MKLRKLLYVGLILLTLGVVLYIGMRSGDLPASLEAIARIPFAYVAACVLCVFGGILMQTLSCRLAFAALGHGMAFGRLYAIMLLGEFYSYITPGASGGQPMQVYQFHRDHLPAGDTTAALTLHFQCFQITLLSLDLLLFALYRDFISAQIGANLPLFVIGFLANLALVSGSIMIAFYQRPVRFLVKMGGMLLRRLRFRDPDRLEKLASGLAEGYYDAMRSLASDKRRLAGQFALALVRILLVMSVMFFIYRGLGQSAVGYGRIVAMGCLQYTSAAYTPLPGASGAQEGVFGLYFSGILPGSLLLSALLCWRFVTYYLVLIVGFFVTTALGLREREA